MTSFVIFFLHFEKCRSCFKTLQNLKGGSGNSRVFLIFVFCEKSRSCFKTLQNLNLTIQRNFSDKSFFRCVIPSPKIELLKIFLKRYNDPNFFPFLFLILLQHLYEKQFMLIRMKRELFYFFLHSTPMIYNFYLKHVLIYWLFLISM